MTCGKWGQPGHEGHICIDCTEMWNDCPLCRLGVSCNFKLAIPEILKKRDEIFSSKKDRIEIVDADGEVTAVIV